MTTGKKTRGALGGSPPAPLTRDRRALQAEAGKIGVHSSASCLRSPCPIFLSLHSWHPWNASSLCHLLEDSAKGILLVTDPAKRPHPQSDPFLLPCLAPSLASPPSVAGGGAPGCERSGLCRGRTSRRRAGARPRGERLGVLVDRTYLLNE